MSYHNIKLTQTSTNYFPFNDALIWLKRRKRLARQGWNGKNLFVYLVNETTDMEFETEYDGFDLDVQIQPYFLLVSSDTANTWVPSVSDILANDWYVVNQVPELKNDR